MSEHVDDIGGKVTGTEATARPNLFLGVVKAMRPRQWVKNVLVSGRTAGRRAGRPRLPRVLITSRRLRGVLPGSSAIYLVNDVRDVEADRAHPTKRYRPIAAGVVPAWLATRCGRAGGGRRCSCLVPTPTWRW